MTETYKAALQQVRAAERLAHAIEDSNNNGTAFITINDFCDEVLLRAAAAGKALRANPTMSPDQITRVMKPLRDLIPLLIPLYKARVVGEQGVVAPGDPALRSAIVPNTPTQIQPILNAQKRNPHPSPRAVARAKAEADRIRRLQQHQQQQRNNNPGSPGDVGGDGAGGGFGGQFGGSGGGLGGMQASFGSSDGQTDKGQTFNAGLGASKGDGGGAGDVQDHDGMPDVTDNAPSGAQDHDGVPGVTDSDPNAGASSSGDTGEQGPGDAPQGSDDGHPDPPPGPPGAGTPGPADQPSPTPPDPGDQPGSSGGSPNPDDGSDESAHIHGLPRYVPRRADRFTNQGYGPAQTSAIYRLLEYGTGHIGDDGGGVNPRFFGSDPSPSATTTRGDRGADPDSAGGGDPGVSGGGSWQGGGGPADSDTTGTGGVGGDPDSNVTFAIAPSGPDPDNEWGAGGYNPHYQPSGGYVWTPYARSGVGTTRAAPARVQQSIVRS